MAIVIISLKDDSRIYTYDSILKTVKSGTRKDTSFRCYEQFEMRIDVMPNDKYHKTYFISGKILEKLKLEVPIERPSRIKSKELTYGLLIADSLKGYDKNKNFLYNVLATQKYDKEYILDTMNFVIANGMLKCTPAGSEKTTFSTALFYNMVGDNFTEVRRILGINDGNQDISGILQEYNLNESVSYVGTCYYDDNKLTVSSLYEIRSEII